MLRTRRVNASVAALAVTVFALAFCVSPTLGSSEYEGSTEYQASAPRSTQNVSPPRLLSSSIDENTGLQIDRYIKPLGSLRPGEVLNTDPTGPLGTLLRPEMNSSTEPMLVARLTFDLVNGDTLDPLPLDRLYNHHLVIYSRPDTGSNTNGKTGSIKLENLRDNPSAANVLGRLASGLHSKKLSAVLAPCGVGAFFAGGGAEWRGKIARQTMLLNSNPTGDAAWFEGGDFWLDPPSAKWGVNIHAIDLRSVESVKNAVQCNCAYYALTNPGTPQNFDHSPKRGGGIECCGDQARGRTVTDSNDTPTPIALTYEVHWAPLSKALSVLSSNENVSKTLQVLKRGAPKTTTLMVSSSPDLDGASCFGEYNVRPCPGTYEVLSEDAPGDTQLSLEERKEKEAKAWSARANGSASNGPKSPRDQKCAEFDSRLTQDRKRPVTVATSHVFRLPQNTAYDVSRITGHQHVGGFGIRLLNVTGVELESTNPEDVPYPNAPVVCESLPRYGTTEGEVGNEKGFLVEMSECVFDPPVRFLPNQTFVVQSVYGADKDNFAPAGFPPPYEGVMGYITMTFTIPDWFEPAVFSLSGERALVTDDDDSREESSDGFGTCVTSAESTDPSFEKLFADSPAASPEPSATSLLLSLEEEDDEDEEDNEDETTSQKKSTTLTLLDSYPALTMSWKLSDRTTNAVEFELSLVDTSDEIGNDTNSAGKQSASPTGPTWLSIGIHRPGGHGMPGADMVVVQSFDGGTTWSFDEHYTSAYDAPKKRSFYGETVSVIKDTNCAVAFFSESSTTGDTNKTVTTQVVSFTRRQQVPEADSGTTVANVTKGQRTPVIWAFGKVGQTRMTYHGVQAGETFITW